MNLEPVTDILLQNPHPALLITDRGHGTAMSRSNTKRNDTAGPRVSLKTLDIRLIAAKVGRLDPGVTRGRGDVLAAVAG